MGETNAAIQSRGGLPVMGDGVSLMTYNASSVTSRSTFKCVMVSEPYRNTCYLKQVMAVLPYIRIYFFKTLKSLIK